MPACLLLSQSFKGHKIYPRNDLLSFGLILQDETCAAGETARRCGQRAAEGQGGH